jgi:iron complex transport system permease protein
MQKKYIQWLLFIVALLAVLLVVVFVSLSSGEVKITYKNLLDVLADKESIEYTVLTKIRYPRIVLGIAVGGALSLSGAILQGIYRNPLVEPYTLGISGGAALGVALVLVAGIGGQSYFTLPVSGFVGALVTLFLVYTLSVRRAGLSMNSMLLIGVMVSFVSSSAMMFLMSLSTSETIHNIVFWVMGSLDEPNSILVKIAFWSSVGGLLISVFFARSLNALRLGEVKARHLGIDTGTSIKLLFVLSSLLTGIAVSVAGVIGFVGLVIPHLIRLTIGNDYRVLLIGSFLGGAIFLVLSDTLARTVIAPNELPIGVITGFAGGLMFIIVLSRSGAKFKMR